MKVKRALISVSDKAGIVDFARALHELGVEIVSTGGTARAILEAGVPVVKVEDLPGSFPEMLGGRVKTLQPPVHGGILVKQNNEEQLAEIAEHQVEPFQLVAVNFYPWEKKIAEIGLSIDQIIEEGMDIGGPTMVSSGIKNYPFVVTVTDPADYDLLISELQETGEISLETSQKLAVKAAHQVAWYRVQISRWMAEKLSGKTELFPKQLLVSLQLDNVPRYGENWHQKAAVYKDPFSADDPLAYFNFTQLQGKKMSYNNWLDWDSAVNALCVFDDQTTCIIIKHTNSCGLAQGDNISQAFSRAFSTDSLSAFGGIVAVNCRLGIKEVRLILEKLNFFEILIAPSITPQAQQRLAKKKDLRVLVNPAINKAKFPTGLQAKPIRGGKIIQEVDSIDIDPDKIKVVTDRHPTDDEWQALHFAWKVVKIIKSNAIVFCQSQQTVGVGAGQMSRIDSLNLAVAKAKESGNGDKLKGSAMGSDAFFPFSDCVNAAHKQGVTAIIQPGGSKRDDESIAAANEHGMTMVFTGVRHFRH